MFFRKDSKTEIKKLEIKLAGLKAKRDAYHRCSTVGVFYFDTCEKIGQIEEKLKQLTAAPKSGVGG